MRPPTARVSAGSPSGPAPVPNLPAHLGQPGRGHRGPAAVIAGQHHEGSPDRGVPVGLLHQLPAGRRPEPGQVAGGVLLGGADVEPVHGPRPAVQQRRQPGGADPAHPRLTGDRPGRRLRPPGHGRRHPGGPALLAVVQVQPGQAPADGPVAQRHHRLGSPALISDWVPMMLRVRPAQLTTTSVAGPGASAAARSTSSAPGTLVAVGMLIVWYSSNRRASSDHHVGAAPQQGAGARPAAMAGCPAARLDQLAERLARRVDVAEQFAAPAPTRPARRPGPTRGGSRAQRSRRTAARRRPGRPRTPRWARTAGAAGRRPRPPAGRAGTPRRTADAPRRTAFRAHVQQRDLGPVPQGPAHVPGWRVSTSHALILVIRSD